MKAIISALIKSQKEIKNAVKDAKNPHLKNNYASLESVLDAIKEVANENKLAIVQVNGKDNLGDYVDTVLYHESGEKIESRCYLVIERQNMQGLGSAITYARRYSLASLFCITQEDDDGNVSRKPIDQEKFAKPKADPGEFVVSFGKMRGKKLSDYEKLEVNDYMNYIMAEAQRKNQEITGDVKAFIDAAREYIR